MTTRRGETRALVRGDDNEAQLHRDDSYSDDDDDVLVTSRRNKKSNGHNASEQSRRNFTWASLISWFTLLLLFAIGVVGLATILNFNQGSKPKYIGGSGFQPGSDGNGDGGGQDDDSDERSSDQNDTATLDEISADEHHDHYVHYDTSPFLQEISPFDLDASSKRFSATFGAGIFTPPRMFDNDHFYEIEDEDLLGYLQHPSIVNNTLVFCAEGDMYVTSTHEWLDKHGTKSIGPSLRAMKLTATDGNVLSPRVNPVYPHWLAFTATYSGRREVYLMDLRGPRAPSVRLTYWDSGSGVAGLVGWTPDGTGLLIRSRSITISMPDIRMYKLQLQSLSSTNEERADDGGDARRRRVGESNSFLTDSTGILNVLQIEPIPLTQAIDGVVVGSCLYFVRFSQSSQTIRYVGGTAESLWVYCEPGDSQTSATPKAIPMLDDQYPGTSKSPQLYHYDGKDYILFLSDRGYDVTSNSDDSPSTTASVTYIPDRMNIWALPIGSRDVPSSSFDSKELIQITDVACDFEGRVVREFVVDPVTQHAVVRIGADLYHLQSNHIESKIETALSTRHRQLDDTTTFSAHPEHEAAFVGTTMSNATLDRVAQETSGKVPVNQFAPNATVTEIDSTTGAEVESEAKRESPHANTAVHNSQAESPSKVTRTKAPSKHEHAGHSSVLKRYPIVIHSDFNNQHERIIPISTLRHMTTADVYKTAVGTIHLIMTLRGQLWVSPVEESISSSYQGAGMNMPSRHYRLAPGAMMGGLVRVLAVRHAPNPVEDDISDRRLAVILATDPLTATAEQGFYLVETQSDATPLFMDLDTLPKPFLGGHVNGGSTSMQGLGSVKPDSIVVSPCGRRMAWTDTDGRICAMTMPQYQDTEPNDAQYTVLPSENELGEPMVGDQIDLSWSPGGRYLAVNHNARNQFRIISIVDCGDPTSSEEDRQVAGIKVGRIGQATPSRFNSESMYFGKSTSDIHEFARDQAMSKLFGFPEPEDVTTTLYFLSGT